MRWVLWNGRSELPPKVMRELERIIRGVLEVQE
jgi:hypothetical protein